MIVWGGSNDPFNVTPLGDGARFNLANHSWTTMSSVNAPTARTTSTPSANIWTGSQMITYGGQNPGGLYSPSANSWLLMLDNGAPSLRNYFPVVWTGAEMIAWGGASDANGIQTLSDGGRFNPALNTWSTMRSLGAPSARRSHSAVWTGTEMIVWGGYDSAPNGLGDGARYNPMADAWATLPTGGPSARAGATGVWTGSEAIFWGGVNGSTALGTGGRYSPSANSWTAVNPSGPSPRYNHTAVWTGDRMIIWGGKDASSGVFADGMLYQPGADAWTPVTATASPVQRHVHTAVWTGSEMIVWGGLSSNAVGSVVATGGRYNPLANSWIPTTGSSAPSARFLHTAVWTGSEMIIWGGYPQPFQSGARYNPSLDIWNATTLAGAPVGRGQPISVWTGTQMLIFGGSAHAYGSAGDGTPADNLVFGYTPPIQLYLYARP